MSVHKEKSTPHVEEDTSYQVEPAYGFGAECICGETQTAKRERVYTRCVDDVRHDRIVNRTKSMVASIFSSYFVSLILTAGSVKYFFTNP